MHYLLYALTLLISSSLLFAVQPMIAKMIQPVLGGTPAVWNTAMVFFQASLLAGYLYAHLSTRWLGTRRQSILHLAILVGGLFFLPVAFEAPADTSVLQAPTWWLLGTLTMAVGWPFFVVSTTAPLLQKWFSTTDHPQAADPYHLYAASNMGSILALVAYPFLVEPRFGLKAQSTLWMIAYLVLCTCVALCAAILWLRPSSKDCAAPGQTPPASAAAVTWKRRAKWVLWAFIPSSMMLSVTAFITTDIAPVPLLWIPPLAIYIISFIAAFARRNPIPLRVWSFLFPPLLAASVTLMVSAITDPLWVVTALHFGTLFVFCMLFHGLLAADRPHARDLTEYYLWLAFGGVLGGVFNALVAPAFFDRLVEYPLVLVTAALAVPAMIYRRRSMGWIVLSAAAGAMAFLGWQGLDALALDLGALWPVAAAVTLCTALVAVVLWGRRWTPLMIGLCVAAAALTPMRPESGELLAERSFYGTHRVQLSHSGHHHILYHGTTIHGAQNQHPEFRSYPLTYYYFSGPLGQLFRHLDEREQRHPVAVVGLGTGAVVTYAQPEQRFDLFEIDPVVVSIATNPDLFSFLDDCIGDCQIIVGDGRLQLEATEANRYELIVLDAYSSAAVPVHLLTRQALKAYMHRLRPDGLLAIHISSPYLEMEPVIARTAAQLGLVTRAQQHHIEEDEPLYHFYVDSSHWMVLARTESALGDMADDERWHTPSIDHTIRPWTDDYANVLDIYRY